MPCGVERYQTVRDRTEILFIRTYWCQKSAASLGDVSINNKAILVIRLPGRFFLVFPFVIAPFKVYNMINVRTKVGVHCSRITRVGMSCPNIYLDSLRRIMVFTTRDDIVAISVTGTVITVGNIAYQEKIGSFELGEGGAIYKTSYNVRVLLNAFPFPLHANRQWMN